VAAVVAQSRTDHAVFLSPLPRAPSATAPAPEHKAGPPKSAAQLLLKTIRLHAPGRPEAHLPAAMVLLHLATMLREVLDEHDSLRDESMRIDEDGAPEAPSTSAPPEGAQDGARVEVYGRASPRTDSLPDPAAMSDPAATCRMLEALVPAMTAMLDACSRRMLRNVYPAAFPVAFSTEPPSHSTAAAAAPEARDAWGASPVGGLPAAGGLAANWAGLSGVYFERLSNPEGGASDADGYEASVTSAVRRSDSAAFDGAPSGHAHSRLLSSE